MFPVGPAQSGSGRKEYQSQIAFLTRTLSKMLDTRIGCAKSSP
jgi:hypothetical protein